MMIWILFTVCCFLVDVTATAHDDDRAAMLALSRSFQPNPPHWSTKSSFAYCKWKGVECNLNNHRVISLNLANLSLSGMISEAIISLPELVDVYLQNNKLHGYIPKLPKHVKFVYRPGNPMLKHNSGANGKLTIGIVFGSISGGTLVLMTICVLVYLYRLRKTTVANLATGRMDDDSRALIRGPGLFDDSGRDDGHSYSMETLRHATNDFSEDNIVGQGGFGVVYKGVQRDGTMIAVKRKDSRLVDERALSEFNNEVNVLTNLRHKHLVPLLGYCDDGTEKLLVYEYMPQGTLAHHLFEWSGRGYPPLTWNQRITIALDVARGVQYLHGLARRSYIHRDLKPSNILIGDGLRAKISDFGCIKLAPEDIDSIETTTVVGTFGYIDPLYVATKRVTKKADVFAFGVILMEMMTGRKANDDTLTEDEHNLVMWLRPKLKDDNFLRLLDVTIATDEDTMKSIQKIAELAVYCTSQEVENRPDMFQIVNWLVPLVEHWDPPPREKDEEEEKDSTTLLQKLDKWKAAEGTSFDFGSGEGSSRGEIALEEFCTKQAS